MKQIAILLLITVILSISYPISGSNQSTIHMDVYTDKSTYLNDETINITYFIYGDNGKMVFGSGRWYLKYWNYTSMNYTIIAQGNFTRPDGTIAIDLNNYNISNAGIGRNYWIDLFYSTSDSQVSKTLMVTIMDVSYYYFKIYLTPISGAFSPGRYVKITLSSPVPSLPINYIHIFYNSGTIAYLRNKRFDNDGLYYETFQIPNDISPGKKVYVKATVKGRTENSNFTVQRDYGIYIISNKKLTDKFLSGDYINLTVRSEKEIDSPYYHFVVKSGSGKIITETFQDYKNFSYRISDDFQGTLIIICSVFNSTQKIATLKIAVSVVYADLHVYFNKNYYSDNDSFTAYVDFKSKVISDPKIVYNVFADFGYGYELIKSINTDNRSLTIKVAYPYPQSYKVVVYAINDQFVSSSMAVINYSNPITINAYVMTHSNYASGIYTPGQSVEIKFEINGNINDAVLRYGLDENFYTNPKIWVLGDIKSGTITVKIPDHAKTGIHIIHMEISYTGGSVDKEIYIQVDENPPWSLYLVWGIPIVDFIILLIIITLTVSLYLYVKCKEKGIVEE